MMLQRLADHFGVPIDYFYPSTSTASSSARDWLQQLRKTSLNAAETIATRSDVHFADEDKAVFLENVRNRLGKTQD